MQSVARGCVAWVWGVLCLLPAGLLAAEKQEAPRSVRVMKAWKVQRAAAATELGGKFFATDFDDAAWETADIQEREDPYKDRYVFYRKWVEIPAAWQGKKISLVFGAVDDDAVVYVNGKKVGEHQGYDEEFEVDITAAVQPGQKALVAVVADNSGGGGCGIWKPVTLGLAEAIGQAAKEAQREAEAKREAESRAILQLGKIRHKLVYESFQDTNWEIMMVNADGSNPVNLTRTPDADELYPHVSPDGKKICFIVDVRDDKGQPMRRDLYYMNMDGTGRTKIAENAREGCWNADGTQIAYLKGESDRFTYTDFANKGVFIYDLKTATHTPHPNKDLFHLYNLCWSPTGDWFIATVHGGMGFGHAILAIEAKGNRVVNLNIPGCRPDFSPDGKRIAWGGSDFDLYVADFDLSTGTPRAQNRRLVVHSDKPLEAYHVDWSPDGRYVSFSRGGKSRGLRGAPEIIGIRATGWNICVADASRTNCWVQITADGKCNKESDWVFVPEAPER